MEAIEEVKEKLGNKIKNFSEKNNQRCYININPKDIFESVKIMSTNLGFRFATATGIDTKEGIEILYHFSHDKTGKITTFRVVLTNKEKPEIESITPILKGAEWIEQEIWEMLGVNFKGHPNLKRLLLAEDWPEGNYPLRQKEQK